MSDRILIVDNSTKICQHLGELMTFMGYSPTILSSGEISTTSFSEDDFHVVLLEAATSAKDTLSSFRALKEIDKHVPIILIVDPDNKQRFNQELDTGCIARLPLPVKFETLEPALQQVQLYREHRHQDGVPRSMKLFRSLGGNSDGIMRVRHMMEQVADTEANVLIMGSSGSGKEVVARNIHYHSNRRNKPFVPINCGAIPPDLLESELFGHEKGAFTGAISSRQGRFEMAEGGTLFLDEIGDMSLPMQVKLLRVLQERTFERVGSNKSIEADVRIIAATHVNLEDAIEAGRFREDLFYRLNVFPIEMPALKDRSEDLPLLITDLTARLRSDSNVEISLTNAAIESLMQYSWPGNVRELANLIERLSILYPNAVVDIQDLPEKYQAGELLARQPDRSDDFVPLPTTIVSTHRLPKEGLDLREHINQIQESLIQQALDESNGVVAHAAKRLNMGRTTLVEKMRKLDMNRKEMASGF